MLLELLLGELGPEPGALLHAESEPHKSNTYSKKYKDKGWKYNSLNKEGLRITNLPYRGSVSWRWWWGCLGDAAADCSSAHSPSASAWSEASGWVLRLNRSQKNTNKRHFPYHLQSFSHAQTDQEINLLRDSRHFKFIDPYINSLLKLIFNTIKNTHLNLLPLRVVKGTAAMLHSKSLCIVLQRNSLGISMLSSWLRPVFHWNNFCCLERWWIILSYRNNVHEYCYTAHHFKSIQ